MKNYRILLLSLLLLSFLSACSPVWQQEVDAHVNLNDLQPLPTPSQESTPLRVAVAAVISPKGTIDSYSTLIDYLEKKTGRSVELIQRRTYLEINDLVERGEVDVAFVCTSAYIVGRDGFKMRLLVAPQVDGQTTYQSYLIVPAESAVQNMADLRGTVFAYTDPISLTGRVYPISMVEKLGSAPEDFFSRTFFTYSHDEAIYAVANHLADGAAVDSLVYDFAVSRDPSLAEKTRVIHKSPLFGIPPVVVGPNVRPQIAADLQALLLEMNNDADGRDALNAMGVERFVLIEDANYETVRSLVGSVSLTDVP